MRKRKRIFGILAWLKKNTFRKRKRGPACLWEEASWAAMESYKRSSLLAVGAEEGHKTSIKCEPRLCSPVCNLSPCSLGKDPPALGLAILRPIQRVGVIIFR
jgi:hypothetical protein